MDNTSLSQTITDAISSFFTSNEIVEIWFSSFSRFLFPILAIWILAASIRSLLRTQVDKEVWAYLSLPNGEKVALNHWENIIGRAPSADVVLAYPSISRTHAALIRNDSGEWEIHDLSSTSGTKVDDLDVDEVATVKIGQTITFANVPVVLIGLSAEENIKQAKTRKQNSDPVSPWGALLLLTIFQILTSIQIIISAGDEQTPLVLFSFLGLIALEWGYYIFLKIIRRTGFEMETIAFFLCTLSLAITSSSVPEETFKQFLTVALGVIMFLILGWFLRSQERALAVRPLAVGIAVILFMVTLVFADSIYGARNWVKIGSFSFQPSEFIKIAFVWAGAASMERLFTKRNLALFILFSGFCLGCLAIMSDFGTAAIFFVTFIVIAFLRSGDFATLALICGGTAFAGMMVVRFKPYIADRFAVWGHAWEFASTTGYQQTRTMSAAASGGLVGVGVGNGWLHNIAAADTDLVFGMVCEEWGLIIAVLSVLCIITLAIFAVRSCKAGRGSFYTIAACGAMSLLVFQTILNVFGAVDLLPLTGVTFPFVSNGGSSMLSSWCLLSFLKAADTRQNASFAIKIQSKRQMRALDNMVDLPDEYDKEDL